MWQQSLIYKKDLYVDVSDSNLTVRASNELANSRPQTISDILSLASLAGHSPKQHLIGLVTANKIISYWSRGCARHFDR